MAPKQPEEKPHIPSSSEEDESGSSEEQSESTREDSKKDDSSDDENESKPTQTSVVVPVSTKKLEPDSESESESESDSEPIQKMTSGSITTKSTLPESKRKETEDVLDVKKNKKMKTGDGEVKKISGDEAKLLFQRLFSESDEIALLQGILDFNAKKGDYQKDMDAFVDYVKKLISFNANRSQLKTKIQRLKKKFANIVKNSLKKGKSEDEIVFSKDLDQKAFELSRQIWGNNGVQVSKSRKKKHEEETPREFKPLLRSSKKRQETVKADARDTSLELSSFFKTENVSAFSLDESALSAVWGTVKDGSKKREMEERLKKLKATQGDLCMQRTGLVADSAKLIFKDKASSSSCM
ncbi:hypothetical protein AALP_AA2G063900 [Arabis alpina]|uniref:Glabrous enhancer-binding protein-like DBD domain-containing protein n=1 Tax=Arabis alpina TaxID=50452 RepID=A0A087HFN8_ARAAL|nr:hypothetical protein AALP_AA2G063900 [Arabis alpina]